MVMSTYYPVNNEFDLPRNMKCVLSQDNNEPKLPPVQKFGARVMRNVGKLRRDEPNVPDSLEMAAYNPNYKGARRIWASLAAVALAGSAVMGYIAADKVDDHFACSGEKITSVKSGDTIEGIVASIPHDNTSASEVRNAIADMNPESVGEYFDTQQPNFNEIKIGPLIVPEECNSLI